MDNNDTKSTLKSYFQSGDVPTEGQFAELIDEALNDNIENLTAGTLSIERLPKQLDLTQHSDVSNAVITSTQFIGGFTGDGSEISNLNVNALNSYVPIDKLPLADSADLNNAATDKLINAALLSGELAKQNNNSIQRTQDLETKITTLSSPQAITSVHYIVPTTIDVFNTTIIDGQALQDGDLLLLLGQGGTANRIYVFNTVGGLTVAPNFTDDLLTEGLRITSEKGIAQSNLIYMLTTIRKGIDHTLEAIEWHQVFDDHLAGDGIVEHSNRWHLDFANTSDVSNKTPNKVINAALLSDELNKQNNNSAQHTQDLETKITTLSNPQAITRVHYIVPTTIDVFNTTIIDGQALHDGDLLLLLGQGGTANRIYVFNTVGGLTIAPNFADDLLTEGLRITSEKGIAQSNLIYMLTTMRKGIDHTLEAIEWHQVFDDHLAGDGIVEHSNRWHLDFANSSDISNKTSNKVINAALLSDEFDKQNNNSMQRVQDLETKITALSRTQTITRVHYIVTTTIDVFNTTIIDGQALHDGDLLLLLGQGGTANRIYVFNTVGGLTVAPNFTDDLLTEGLRITTEESITQSNLIYMLTTVRKDIDQNLQALEWHQVFGDYFAGEGIAIDDLTISINTIPEAKLPQASIIEKGAVILANNTDINDGTDADKAITPLALKQANLLEHLFEFVEDTGQAEEDLVIPEGKILALYKTNTGTPI